MQVFATTNAEQILELGKIAAFTELEGEAQRGQVADTTGALSATRVSG